MATIYKIHPAIGVARVGNSPTEFFIGPESPDSPGVEIGADGSRNSSDTLQAQRAGQAAGRPVSGIRL